MLERPPLHHPALSATRPGFSKNLVDAPSLSPATILSPDELVWLVRRVFAPGPCDTGIAILVDLPDQQVQDEPAWRERRRIAREWTVHLASSDLGLPVGLFGYRNVRLSNAELPENAWFLIESVDDVDTLDPANTCRIKEIFQANTILIAPTRFSATAPLKLAAPKYGFRAITMPGLTPAMVPALRLDYGQIAYQVRRLKSLLDRASAAAFLFEVAGRQVELHLDLRFRQGHASTGLVREPGTTSNLPSGEAYVVPYEGERAGEPSRSRGTLPVELDGEVVLYEIRENRAVAVADGGAVAAREAELLRREPAYGNLAELGLGVLADFGVEPLGEILIDEKLGLHIAFGRSDHFGGRVGAADFSRADAVVHIDRVYLPATQPQVRVRRVDLVIGGAARPLMRDGSYAAGVLG